MKTPPTITLIKVATISKASNHGNYFMPMLYERTQILLSPDGSKIENITRAAQVGKVKNMNPMNYLVTYMVDVDIDICESQYVGDSLI